MSLKIYPVVLDLVRRLSPVIRVLRSRSSALADQMERALTGPPSATEPPPLRREFRAPPNLTHSPTSNFLKGSRAPRTVSCAPSHYF